jgi:hypothetical protein
VPQARRKSGVKQAGDSAEAEGWFWRLLESRHVRSLLGLGVVVGGGSLLSIVWILHGAQDTNELTKYVIGLMGIVLGFYFGREGVEDARREAEDARERASRESQYARGYRDATREYEETLEKVLPGAEAFARLLDAAERDATLDDKIKHALGGNDDAEE